MYHGQSDFSLEDDLRDIGERRVAEQQAEMEAASAADLMKAVDLEEGEERHWENFHQMHSTAQFFKERRYLVKAFPELLDAQVTNVLEVGCGTGSTAVALLRAREGAEIIPAIHVTGVDFSEKAVALASENVDAAGFTARFSSHHCDICTSPPPPPPSSDGMYDAALMIFTLSAIAPESAVSALRNVGAAMRDGSRIFLRDYAQYDLAMLRFKGAAVIVPGELYRRSDGTLARFMTLDSLKDLVRKAGPEFEWNDGQYLCIKLENRKTGQKMHRVFIEARLTYRGKRT